MTALALLLFAEAPADAWTVECLLDRALSEDQGAPTWIADSLDAGSAARSEEIIAARGSVRRWINEHFQDVPEAGDGFIDVHHLDEISKRLQRGGRFRLSRGHFDGEPGKHAAKLGRKALDLADELRKRRPVDAVVLAQDMDTDPSRRDGLEQARQGAEKRGAGFAIVLACPIQCHEAWPLAAFEPCDDAERQRHQSVSQRLGFDPCAHSDRLHHHHARSDSASKVLDELTEAGAERRERALRTAPLKTLRAKGRSNGLADFLGEVGERIAPLARRVRSYT